MAGTDGGPNFLNRKAFIVHAAADRSAENKAERALRDEAVHGGNPSVGEINA